MKHGACGKFGALIMLCAAALPAGASGSQPSREDIQWLERVTYGPTTATVDEYLKLGRRRFLSGQLHPKDVRLPQPAAAQIDALEISHHSTAELLATVSKEQQRMREQYRIGFIDVGGWDTR